MKKAFLVSLSLTAALLASANTIAANGHALMDGVSANQKIDKGEAPSYQEAVAWGYLTGLLRATSGIMQNTGGICPTGAVNKGQLLETVTTWLNRHPERLDDPDYVLVALALAEKYPCSA